MLTKERKQLDNKRRELEHNIRQNRINGIILRSRAKYVEEGENIHDTS